MRCAMITLDQFTYNSRRSGVFMPRAFVWRAAPGGGSWSASCAPYPFTIRWPS